MTPRLRAALFVALGFALGIGVASFADDPPPPPPHVEPLGGTYKGSKLRPVTITESGKASRLGEPGDGELIHVYLEVSGVPVGLSFAP